MYGVSPRPYGTNYQNQSSNQVVFVRWLVKRLGAIGALCVVQLGFSLADGSNQVQVTFTQSGLFEPYLLAQWAVSQCRK